MSKIEQSGPVILDSKSHNIENVISKASEKYKVNSDLIRTVIRAESDFNPDCTSSTQTVKSLIIHNLP